MASSSEFSKYVVEQMQGAGEIVCRKMFGEYGLYCNGIFFGMICDDQLFIKITEAGARVCPNCEQAPPYPGAKPHFVVNADDPALLAALIVQTCGALPRPGSRRKNECKRETLDYKKAYPDLYRPTARPALIDVPPMIFLMVDGSGDPNTSEAYRQALEALYGLSYTIKMSKMNGTQPPGYFEYVVPPLEGLWRLADDGYCGGPVQDKSAFRWTSMIRQPEFVTPEVFARAKDQFAKKRPEANISAVRLETLAEGLCCQVMHTGPYDDEPATLEKLHAFIEQAGYVEDFSGGRQHHEIYLSDPRKTAPPRMKTILRHPVRRVD